MSQQQQCGILVLLAILVTGKIFHRSFIDQKNTAKTPVKSLKWLKCVFSFRGFHRKDHRRPGGPSLLHQVSGVPSVLSGTLLRGNVGAPSVGGFCCPLLDTVSTATNYATLVKEEKRKSGKCCECVCVSNVPGSEAPGPGAPGPEAPGPGPQEESDEGGVE